MDGVAALKKLLHADAAVTALVPATRIQAGALPQGVVLPALAIESIAQTDRNIPNPGAYRHVSERVQVTVLASSYPSQQAILRALRKAGDAKTPTVTGIENVTVHLEGAGPDMMNAEASVYLRTQDFRVTYSEAR